MTYKRVKLPLGLRGPSTTPGQIPKSEVLEYIGDLKRPRSTRRWTKSR